MKKYIKKPVELDVYTFDELTDYGCNMCEFVINGLPSQFIIDNKIVKYSKDTDEYIIQTLFGNMFMTRDHVLIVGAEGKAYLRRIDYFKERYIQV